MSKEVWYGDGLRFQCTGCGHCCTGDPGYVYATQAEIKALAAAMGEVAEFEAAYVRRVGRRKSLVELANGDCIFFDNLTRRCRVYEARPRQCRTWPFWPSNVRTHRTWEETCRVCPGCGKGPLVPQEEIAAQAGIVRV